MDYVLHEKESLRKKRVLFARKNTLKVISDNGFPEKIYGRHWECADNDNLESLNCLSVIHKQLKLIIQPFSNYVLQ